MGHHVLAIIAIALIRRAGGCETDADCGLLGNCIASTCACDEGWEGPTCASLDLAPAPIDSGLRQANSSSWCGTVLRDEVDDGLFHGYFSDFGGCADGLRIWLTGSRVIHATSRAAAGPFAPAWSTGDAEVAVAAEAHNPQAVRAPDGTYLLLDSYGGPDSGCIRRANYSNCAPWAGPCPAKMPGTGGRGLYVFHTAPSAAGPWTPLNVSIDYPCFSENITPSPAFHPNGTMYILYHCDTAGEYAMGDLVMVRADTFRGPFTRVNERVWSVAGVGPHPEDPFLWLRTSPAGIVSWHIILHNRPRGLHLYSTNGLSFSLQQALNGTEPMPPFVFTENVTQSDGTTFVANRRERPWLLFSPGSSRPEVLVTSMEATAVQKTVFTHAQTVN